MDRFTYHFIIDYFRNTHAVIRFAEKNDNEADCYSSTEEVLNKLHEISKEKNETFTIAFDYDVVEYLLS